MNRRNFLLTTATGLLVQNSWAQNFINSKQPTKFLFVFLRGGIDGLNVVIPTSSSFYYDIRPHINIPKASNLIPKTQTLISIQSRTAQDR